MKTTDWVRHAEESINLKLTRRSFLKLACSLCGSSLATTFLPFPDLFRSLTDAEAANYARGGIWIDTCCNMCGGQTGIRVLLQDGAVKKIEPNRFNPVGVANIRSDYEVEKTKRHAVMCPKGNAGMKALYDPDRIKMPMKQMGLRGSNNFLPISWDQALTEIAQKLRALEKPEQLLWFSEDHSFTNIQQDFCAAFGTPNYHNHSNLCDVERKAHYRLTVGDERPLPDFQNASYIILFGWNPTSATKWAYLPAIINRARETGAKFVVVDPVFSLTASKADEWVPIVPGTDGPMALAMAQHIIASGLQDHEFISKWVVGFDEFKAFVIDKTPEWAEAITTVPASTIKRLAEEIAMASKSGGVVIDVWSGPGQHSNGVQGGRAINALNAILGQINKPGTMVIPTRSGNKRRSSTGLDWPTITAKRIDGRGTKYPFAHGSGIYVETRNAILEPSITDAGYLPKAAIIVFQNLVMSIPNTQKTIDALKKLDLVVVVDTMLSETAMLADYILPGSVYLERHDFTTNWVTFTALSLRQPVVKGYLMELNGDPNFPDTDYESNFVIELARKLGLSGFGSVGEKGFYEKILDKELKDGGFEPDLGVTYDPNSTNLLDALKARPGTTVIKGNIDNYNKHLTPVSGVTDPATKLVYDKPLDDPGKKVVGIEVDGQQVQGFITPSRKCELYSKQLKDKGFNPLPEFTVPEDNPTENYPLYLVNWKQTEHTHSRTFNNPWLMEMKGDNPLWMNTETAKKSGLNNGDAIVIESPYAKARATLHVTECIHPQVVGFQHGYGHTALGRLAKNKGTNDSLFTPGKADKISGQALHKEVGVRIYKAKK